MISKPLFIAAALLTLPVLASPLHAEEESAPEAEKKRTIVISGDDAEFVDAVAAELRAAGFDVVTVASEGEAHEDAAIVSIERVGGAVVVHAIQPEGALEAELGPSTDADGMTDRQATALRAAEAIRSLVTTPKARAAETPEQEPTVPSPPPAPAAPSPPKAPPAAPQWTAYPGSDAPLSPPGEIREMPVLRLGLFGGAGILSPVPALALGVSMRGQLSSHASIAGLLTGTKSFTWMDEDASRFEMYSARAALLASWEILGADHVWTPSIGGGVVGEVRYWNGFGDHLLDDDSGHDDIILPAGYTTLMTEGAMFGVGLAATAGVSISHPFRFRFDVHGDVRMVTMELDGTGHEEMAPAFAPSVLGTMGFEYDFVTEPVLIQTARR